MHFYRNNTKNKVIPVSITKAVLVFFATYMINQGCDKLVQACDNIQKGILFMILRSEGDKIKYCNAPARDRKYVIVSYTHLALDFQQSFLEDSRNTVINSINELSQKGSQGAFVTAA